jgi:PAS domain S-box-containing protein
MSTDNEHPKSSLNIASGHSDEERRFRAMASIAFRGDLGFSEKILQFLEMGRAEFAADFGVLARVDGDTFRVEHAVAASGQAPIGFECDVRQTLCHETLNASEALAVEAVGASEYRAHPAYIAHKPEAYIGATVWVYGRKYGTLCFSSRTPRTRPFTEADREYVRLMALWAGSDLERVMLQEELETRVEERSRALAATARREKLLREIGLHIRNTVAAHDIEDHAAQLLGAALSADRCFFVHFDLSRDYMRIGSDWRRHDLPSAAGEYKPSAFALPSKSLLASHGSQVLNDVDDLEWSAATITMLATFRMRAVVNVPLFRDGELETVLCVAMECPRAWTQDEIGLVEAVAAQTRSAIESAAIIERERRIATTLQDALLPPLPDKAPGMEIGHAYRPALSEANVGGDSYAVYPINAHTYALVVGDVSGKGLAAASHVAALQNILRYALCSSRSLSEAITQMNSVVIEHSLVVGFATLFVGLYDSEKLTLTYCSCGHEPPLIVAASEMEPLQTTGPPLGVMEGVVYKEQTVSLAVGDTIFIYTDGLSEAGPDRHTLLGSNGLAEIVRRRANEMPISDLPGEVMSDVVAFANGRLQDDACIIAAKLVGVAEETGSGDDGEMRTATEASLSASSPLGERLRATPLEEQFRLLVAGVTEYAIFLLDLTGHIVTWNKGAEMLKGYSASEIVGKHFSIFYQPEDVQRGHPQEELAIAAAVGRYEEEGWRVRKDGTQFWANVLITALYDDSGNLYGYGKITRDFTDRRAAEEARLQTMRDHITQSFLRDILYSVTEGRLRYCEDAAQLPDRLPCRVDEFSFVRSGLADMRRYITTTATAAGFSDQRTNDIITAASEAAMNAVVHAMNARCSIRASDNTIQVWIEDSGAGIELAKLHRATLERGFTTEGSLGHGFWLILNTCDRLWLHSTQHGTTVVVEVDKRVPEPEWMTNPRDVSGYFDAPVEVA